MSNTTKRTDDLRAMSEADLDKTVNDARRSIYNTVRSRITKPVENVKAIKTSRKEIARVMTIKRQRELAAEKQQTAA